jgi:hypothetical protein
VADAEKKPSLRPKLTSDPIALFLTIALLACIAGIVVLVVLSGNSAIAGTGLGGLTVVLGGALAARVRAKNGGI